VAFIRNELNVQEFRLRCLNVNEEDMLFDNISLQCPTCRDSANDGRVFVTRNIFPRHEIVVKEEDGDDIDYWPTEIAEAAQWGKTWTWDYNG
jgi:hypothetical protein